MDFNTLQYLASILRLLLALDKVSFSIVRWINNNCQNYLYIILVELNQIIRDTNSLDS